MVLFAGWILNQIGRVAVQLLLMIAVHAADIHNAPVGNSDDDFKKQYI